MGKNNSYILRCVLQIFLVVSLVFFGSDIKVFSQADLVQSSSLLNSQIKVITTSNNSFVIDDSGSLWGWGYNLNGIIKNTGQEFYSSPTWLLGDVKKVSAGSGFVYALKNDNSLWVWGSNFYGALGFGNNEAIVEPSLLMSDVQDIAVGHSTSMILTNSGELYVVGYNGTGLLGNGYTSYSPNYDLTMLRTDIARIYSSAWNFFAIDNQNNLFGWGSNGEKVIFNETSADVSVPKLLLSDVESLSASGTHVLVRRTNGELWGWGSNKYGQLGDLPLNHISEPTFISNEVKLFATGFGHSIVTNNEDQLYIWGADLYYNYTEDQDGYDLYRVGSEYLMENIINLAAFSNHSLALSSDGKLYTWGSAEFGGLSGNGSSYPYAESAYPREIANFSTTGFEPWFYLKSNFEKMNVGSFLNVHTYDKWMTQSGVEAYWSVDNETLASISEDGVLNAHAPGIVNIIATRKDDSSKQVILSIEILENSDYTGPILSNFQKSIENANPGQVIEFSIDIDDFGVGPTNGILTLYDPGMRNLIEITLVYNPEVGNLTGYFEVTSKTFNGEWKLLQVTGFDQVGNESDFNFESEFFTVSGGEDPDFIPPILSDFSMSKTSVVPGDIISFSINVVDNESGPKNGYLTFQGPEVNEKHFVNLKYNSTTGKLEGTFWVYENMSNGVYVFERIYGFDNQKNKAMLDLSTFEFILSGGTEPDLTPPSLSNLLISQNTGKEGDTIQISIYVMDSDSGPAEGYIILLGPQESDVIETWLIYNEESGKLEGSLTIDQSMQIGLWTFESIHAFDSAGNEAIQTLDLFTLLIESPPVEGDTATLGIQQIPINASSINILVEGTNGYSQLLHFDTEQSDSLSVPLEVPQSGAYRIRVIAYQKHESWYEIIAGADISASVDVLAYQNYDFDLSPIIYSEYYEGGYGTSPDGKVIDFQGGQGITDPSNSLEGMTTFNFDMMKTVAEQMSLIHLNGVIRSTVENFYDIRVNIFSSETYRFTVALFDGNDLFKSEFDEFTPSFRGIEWEGSLHIITDEDVTTTLGIHQIPINASSINILVEGTNGYSQLLHFDTEQSDSLSVPLEVPQSGAYRIRVIAYQKHESWYEIIAGADISTSVDVYLYEYNYIELSPISYSEYYEGGYGVSPDRKIIDFGGGQGITDPSNSLEGMTTFNFDMMKTVAEQMSLIHLNGMIRSTEENFYHIWVNIYSSEVYHFSVVLFDGNDLFKSEFDEFTPSFRGIEWEGHFWDATQDEIENTLIYISGLPENVTGYTFVIEEIINGETRIFRAEGDFENYNIENVYLKDNVSYRIRTLAYTYLDGMYYAIAGNETFVTSPQDIIEVILSDVVIQDYGGGTTPVNEDYEMGGGFSIYDPSNSLSDLEYVYITKEFAIDNMKIIERNEVEISERTQYLFESSFTLSISQPVLIEFFHDVYNYDFVTYSGEIIHFLPYVIEIGFTEEDLNSIRTPKIFGVEHNQTYSSDRKISFSEGFATLNGLYFENGEVVVAEGEYTLVVQDVDNNITSVSFVIDKTAPVITIAPYVLEQTSKDIIVIASVNEGTLNTTSYTFTENGSFTFIATDLAGNVTEKKVTITNILKKVSLTAQIVGQGGTIRLSASEITITDQQAFIGDNIKIETQVLAGYRVYRWMVNGQLLAHRNDSFILESIQTDTEVSVEFVMVGDLNNDYQVSATDLVTKRRYLAGLTDISAKGSAGADIDNNGAVSTTDLVRLRRRLAGLE